MRNTFAALALAVGALVLGSAAAAPRVGVAVVADGPQQQLKQIEQQFVAELAALTEGEFDVEFEPFVGDWTLAGITAQFGAAYAAAGIDMVLAVGVTANQLGMTLGPYAKPTFLPFVFEAGVPTRREGENRSGIENLNFLTDATPLVDLMADMQRVARFERPAFVGDAAILEAIPDAVRLAREDAVAALGVEVTVVGHDGGPDLAAGIPRDADGVVVGALPRMSDADFAQFVAAINARNLPSFSLIGVSAVEAGLLATTAVEANFERLARRNALNMQAVILGERAQDQPVKFIGRRRLTINLATATQIGISPRFDVLAEANLINDTPRIEGPVYSLADVGRAVAARNLEVLAEQFRIEAGREDILQARGQLLPQLSAGASHTSRDRSAAVAAGQLAERSNAAAVNLSQLVYSDDAYANLRIQRELQLNREAQLRSTRLDAVLAAVQAFLGVLRTEAQLRVQKDNLSLTQTNVELARDRVRLGSSSAADVYRWESREASDRSSLLRARAVVEQSREDLNRLLNRPLRERFGIDQPTLADTSSLPENELIELINNPVAYERFTLFLIEMSLQRAPELEQLDALLAAKQRELTNLQRDYWLPDVTLNAQRSRNLSQVGDAFGEDDDDWLVSVDASLPIYAGGNRKSRLEKARQELRQLTTLRAASVERLEQGIRALMHAANASYSNIELSQLAADSARKNLELVTDAYAQGTVSVIDLLDAQNASLTADESAANSVYDFLDDVLQVQRQTGEFELLRTPDEVAENDRRLREFLRGENE